MSTKRRKILWQTLVVASIAAFHLILWLAANGYATLINGTGPGSRESFDQLRLLSKTLCFPLVTMGRSQMNSSWGFGIALLNSFLWALLVFYLVKLPVMLVQRLLMLVRQPHANIISVLVVDAKGSIERTVRLKRKDGRFVRYLCEFLSVSPSGERWWTARRPRESPEDLQDRPSPNGSNSPLHS